MRKTGFALFGAALIAAAPLAAMAQPAPGAAHGSGPRGDRGSGAMFDRVDANRDGRVTWEETWTYVQARFAEADRDGNGGLTQQEMQDAMRAMWAGRRGAAQPDGAAGSGPGAGGRPGRGGPDMTEMMGGMFRALDADRNGQVTLVEIRPAVEARFRALDADADNVVERSEVPQHRHGRGAGRGGPGNAPGAAPANPG